MFDMGRVWVFSLRQSVLEDGVPVEVAPGHALQVQGALHEGDEVHLCLQPTQEAVVGQGLGQR